ncbi:hypothetical protein [Micromonospora cathayae]|uniref:DUF1206 domain-containing protein n=1 Tax=Micromonospora cathayae TaxID=3028804 RepID=A0ABY7ZTX2_9ACTN|nr:hypothetical protein [Micromonospora sp. HUAS 3]WDZ86497.1 hypothetical protein PVK37_08920 [Micromonospora sp. HUAS 3]
MDQLTMEQRAAELLRSDDVDREDLRFFLSRLLQIQDDQGRDVTRAISRAVVLGVVFVVLAHGDLVEVELLGMKVQDLSDFRYVIPVAMVLLVLRAVVVLRLSLFYRRVLGEVVRSHLPGWHASGLVPLLTPWKGPMSTHASQIRLDAAEHPGIDRLHQVLRAVDSSSGIVAVVAFQAYAFVNLFQDPRIPDVSVGVSLGLSLLLLAFVGAYLRLVRLSGLPGPRRRPSALADDR